MRSLESLLLRHERQQAWIFGKGPGLDRFDMSTAGQLRICINESIVKVPKPTYFFAHDELPIERVASNWPLSCRAILEESRAKLAARCGIPEELIFVYTKCEGDWSVLQWSAAQIAKHNVLLGLTGTVHSAVHFCRLIGVTDLEFVGMDGKGGYAASIGLAPPLGGGRHDLIRRHTQKMVMQLGFDARFEGA
jgi:hypothetical protein